MALGLGEYIPAAQGLQSFVATDQNFPAGQSVHLALPASEDFPAGQAVHACPACEYLPASQSSHSPCALASCGEPFPALHFEHDVAFVSA